MLKEPESMAQIHRIREQLYEEEKHLSPQERVAKTHREADAILKRWGVTLKRVSSQPRPAAQ
jgi:hypothetical protein